MTDDLDQLSDAALSERFADELFPAESVACDSPRLAWMKKMMARGIDVNDHPEHEGDSELGGRYAVWFRDNTAPDWADFFKTPMPLDYGLCGYGDTMDEAIIELAAIHRIPLWNEEGAA